jgi:hypothetical protein
VLAFQEADDVPRRKESPPAAFLHPFPDALYTAIPEPLQWRMGAKLSAANRYLRNPATRERAVVKSVATSSAIEGIRAPFKRKTGGRYAMTGRVTRKRP